MRPRIPLAYAGLLIIALVAVVGFAAFSPSSGPPPQPEAASEVDAATDSVASARVASAVLALRVSDADSRTATTDVTTTTGDVTPEAAPVTSTTADSTTASDEPEAAATTEAAPADTTPPSLKVTSPSDGATVTDRIITFEGTTERGATVKSGPFEADMADDGTWTIRLVLVEGANGAMFTATDAAGNRETVRVVVHYAPPTTTTTTKAPSGTTTTTTQASGSTWSPLWPADAGGQRDVENWRATVAQYFPEHRVDCVLGIIYRESRGNPRAYNSSSSAEGLMQHLSKYWYSRAKGAGFIDGDGLVATPYNGEANIAAGAYLANYYDSVLGQWWNPWKSGGGVFTATYGTCQSDNPA